VLSSFVADPFVPYIIRFHCPVVVVLNFVKPKPQTYKRRIWLYNEGDYTKFRNNLKSINWDSIINDPDLNSLADKVADNICSAASDSIPNKVITIRPDDVPWMTQDVRLLIRKRNRFHQKAKRLNTHAAWAQFRKSRNETTKVIRDTKKAHHEKLISKINSDNIDT